MKTMRSLLLFVSLLASVSGWAADDYSSLSNVRRIEKKLSSMPKGAERDRTVFKLGLALGALGEPVRGISYLKSIEKQNADHIGQDLIDLNIARLYFQMDDLDKSIATYDQVKKNSDLWLTAQEEKAHAYGRKKEYNKVISTLTTVTSSVFDGAVGPEPYFVEALTYLKICDYADIFKVSGQFKARFKPRLHALQSLINDGGSPHLTAALARLEKGDLNWKTIGPEAKYLPRTFVRDDGIMTNMSLRQQAQKANIPYRVQALNGLITARSIELAKAEIKEIKDTVEKLNIIEAEVIERIHAYDKSKGERPVQGNLASSSSDTLVFPIDKSGEVWLDELDSYQARVKGCPDIHLSGAVKRHL
jgi:hypothetical protein